MRPQSFDNISARLQGFESTRLHENDWRNVVEYVTRLEGALSEISGYQVSVPLVDIMSMHEHEMAKWFLVCQEVARKALGGER